MTNYCKREVKMINTNNNDMHRSTDIFLGFLEIFSEVTIAGWIIVLNSLDIVSNTEQVLEKLLNYNRWGKSGSCYSNHSMIDHA